MTTQLNCSDSEPFLDKVLDPYNEIYREEVDENKIELFFKEYFARSSKSNNRDQLDPPLAGIDNLSHPITYPRIVIKEVVKTSYFLPLSENEQDKVQIQQAILMFKKLFYSSNLNLSSLE